MIEYFYLSPKATINRKILEASERESSPGSPEQACQPGQDVHVRTTKCSVEPPQQTAMAEGRASPSVIVSEQITAQTPSKPRDVDSPSPGNG